MEGEDEEARRERKRMKKVGLLGWWILVSLGVWWLGVVRIYIR